MAKQQAQSDVQPEERKRSPLVAFLNHQAAALEESGKAIISLLPKDFRNHTEKAFEEGKAGWSALIDGAIDEVQCGLNKLRNQPAEKESQTKVKVDVE